MTVQAVTITDPYLMSQLLHDKSLFKPAQPDYIHFRQVRCLPQLTGACHYS